MDVVEGNICRGRKVNAVNTVHTGVRQKMWTLGNRHTCRATEITLLELVPGQSVTQQIGIDPRGPRDAQLREGLSSVSFRFR